MKKESKDGIKKETMKGKICSKVTEVDTEIEKKMLEIRRFLDCFIFSRLQSERVSLKYSFI